MMKKAIYLFVVGSLIGCSLEHQSENEISGDQVINTASKAYGVLSQAYSATPVHPKEYTLFTQDLQPSYLINYHKNQELAYKWNANTITVTATSLWNNYYSAIVHANVLFDSDQNFSTQDKEWQYIKGAAYVIKAYNYFDLLQLFSDRYEADRLGIIPKVSLEVEANARLTQKESLDLIKSNLAQGLELLTQSGKTQNYFINVKGIQLLQARVALYEGDYAKAEVLMQELINQGATLPTTVEEYRSIWNSDNAGVYWLYNNQDNPNQYLYHETNQGDLLYINEDFVFDNQDIRYTVAQYLHSMKTTGNISVDRPLLGKYKTAQSDFNSRNIAMMRSTEVYFILMESLVEQQKLEEAVTVLNQFLTAVNQPTVEPIESQEELRQKIHLEKQKEFVGEKNNFFDLKRWNTAITRKSEDSNAVIMTIDSSDYRWTWPIPREELRYNANAKQNQGWPSLN